MNIILEHAELKDADRIHEMKIEAFVPLLKKYEDFDLSPANEPLEKVEKQISQLDSDYYLINLDKTPIGAIRVVKIDLGRYRISPVFILPSHQGKGIAQAVFHIVEMMYHFAQVWELDTILEEEHNCHLYEKIGYERTNKILKVNDKMTIVYYEKMVGKG